MNLSHIRALVALSLSLQLLFVAGCRSIPGRDFVDYDKMEKNEASPFDESWADESVKKGSYKKFIVAPVETNRLLKLNWWKPWREEGVAEEKAKEFGAFFNSIFKETLEKNLDKGHTIVDAPGPGVLVIESSVAEITPSRKMLENMGAVGSLKDGKKGEDQDEFATISLELRARNSETREVLVQFADRAEERRSIFGGADQRWFSTFGVCIEGWATALVRLAHAESGEAVKKSLAWEVIPQEPEVTEEGEKTSESVKKTETKEIEGN